LLYLLPGLDGTGRLYGPLVAELSTDHDVCVVEYCVDRFESYEALASEIEDRLSLDRPYAIIAESFAGPLATLIAAARPAGLKGVVIAASFLCRPVRASSVLAGVLSALPAWLPPPMVLIEAILLGRWKTPQMRQALDTALRSVRPAVLKTRLKAALRVDASDAYACVHVPVLNIRASSDDLLRSDAYRDFDNLNADFVEVDAPHFVFQALPQESANCIRRFLQERRVFN
jgi:pimeloyl-ACP methyl ester carboxylesterase